ncbi:MAG: hypothetical protein FD177_67 [Desulfovibrionaceae bacterium]|nr:MAG: hypothetical protein FD177_67 [Desulfovibrionaceae bacterium]
MVAGGWCAQGNKNRLTHGMRTREAQEERRQIREVILLMKDLGERGAYYSANKHLFWLN